MPVLERKLFTTDDDEKLFVAEASDLAADTDAGFSIRFNDGRTYTARPLSQRFDDEHDLLYSDFSIDYGDLRGWRVRVFND